MAQEAIEKAEEGDYTGVRNLLELLKTPYSSQPSEDTGRDHNQDLLKRSQCHLWHRLTYFHIA